MVQCVFLDDTDDRVTERRLQEDRNVVASKSYSLPSSNATESPDGGLSMEQLTSGSHIPGREPVTSAAPLNYQAPRMPCSSRLL
ncbi:hypothetical protein VULLAG_LOCUS22872 [Vulpes lagopus]